MLAGDTYHGDSEGKCVPDRECARDLDRQFGGHGLSGSRFGFASYPLDVEGFGMISRLLDSTCTSLRSFDVKDHDDLSVRLFVAFEIQVSILVKG